MATSESEKKENSTRRNILRGSLWALAAAVLVVIGAQIYQRLDSKAESYDVEIIPGEIPADGTSSALLEIRIISRFGNRLNVTTLPHPPTMEVIEGRELVKVVSLGDGLRYRLVSGFNPGTAVVRVQIFGAPGPIEASIDLTPSLADRNGNGYPDAMDLTSESDRTAFRRWFTTIALGQITHVDDRWHDRDCAGLLRYCYREALKRHDNTWLAGRRWLITSAIPDVRKYNYPQVPLVGTKVFNAGARVEQETKGDGTEQQVEQVLPAGNRGDMERNRGEMRRNGREGSGRLSQRTSLADFSEFAEAARLKDNSLAFISRDPEEALPGDVIFYLNDTSIEWPYHTMVYLGSGMTVYHTGPDGDNPGIIKRLSLEQLAHHPNPRWHPVESNPYFLGFYRWKIVM